MPVRTFEDRYGDKLEVDGEFMSGDVGIGTVFDTISEIPDGEQVDYWSVTPAQAREIAAALLEAANEAEAYVAAKGAF